MNEPSTSRANTKDISESTSSHLHRRYFIGPHPENFITQALQGPKSTHDLPTSHAIKSFFSFDSRALKSTLNDIEPRSGIHKKVVDDVWKRSKWGSYLTERKHAKEATAHPHLFNSDSQWIGESFRVGTIGKPGVEEGAIDIIQETEQDLRERMTLQSTKSSTNTRALMAKSTSAQVVPTLVSVPELPDRAATEPLLSVMVSAPPPRSVPPRIAIPSTLASTDLYVQDATTPNSTTALLEPSLHSSRQRVQSVPSRPLSIMKLPTSLTKSDANINKLRNKGKSKMRYDDEASETPSASGVLGWDGTEVAGTSAEPAALVPQPLLYQKDGLSGDGIIMKDRMLVRVTHSKREDLGACFDEQQMRSWSDLHYENWAEFIVVWREDRLELYEDYSFRAREWVKGHKHLSYTIKLKSKDQKTNHANLSLFSFVDMTFCLTCRRDLDDSKPRWLFNREKEGTNIFVMKAKCRTRAVDWIWKLWRYLGGRIPTTIDLVSPLVESKVTLKLPELNPTENGGVLDGKLTRAEVISLCTRALMEHDEWKWVIDHQLNQGKEMELAWRMDTMLDWIWLDHDTVGDFRAWAVICGIAFCQSTMSPQLEIRVAEHFPTSLLLTDAQVKRQPRPVSLNPSSSLLSAASSSHDIPTSSENPPPRPNHLHEPDSIEGYLTRIRPNTQFKQPLYLTVHDGCLFSIDPSHAHPPDPPVPPLPNEDFSTFAWKLRRSEVGRAAHQLSHASAVCDLRRVIAVRRAFQPGLEHHHHIEEPNIGEHDWVEHWTDEEQVVEEDTQDDGGEDGLHKMENKPHVRMRRSFELLFQSGLLIRFETYSCNTAIEWINSLRSLIFYWKQRHLIDAKEEMDLATTRRPRVTPRVHAFCDDEMLPPEAPPDLSAPMPALGTLYNWCVLEGCKPIMRGGRIYSRRGLRGQFKYIQLYLIRGELLRFYIKPNAPFYNVTKKKISLVDAYVCSGYFAAVALPVEQYHPNAPTTPRRYQDGLEADDPEEDLLFVIWYRSGNIPKPEEAICASCNFGGTDIGGADLKSETGKVHVPALSAKRKMAVFRTRSKLERDSWCWAITCEIERLTRSQKERETKLCEMGSLAPIPR